MWSVGREVRHPTANWDTWAWDRLSLNLPDPLWSLHRPALKQMSVIRMTRYMNLKSHYNYAVSPFKSKIYPQRGYFPMKIYFLLKIMANFDFQLRPIRKKMEKRWDNESFYQCWSPWVMSHVTAHRKYRRCGLFDGYMLNICIPHPRAYWMVICSTSTSRIPEWHARATTLL